MTRYSRLHQDLPQAGTCDRTLLESPSEERNIRPGDGDGRIVILVDTDWGTGGKAMAVRLVVTFHAASGKGAELAQAMKARCEVSRQDAGCEQFEVFQSVFDPD